ncbi:enolase C-terminal domain-like protein [Pseudarthrobacter sp. DSP2-3-2b1]|uniref:enolase C-terminal domain-like protein n=1 Tax=Pseudarthrobacter sp. DSP2-3-2b1 TaxID=2804661 RepID=UPI003CF7F893
MNFRRISNLRITPIAFSDPPLLNAGGIHEPHVLRAVLELTVEDGRGGTVVGLSECAGHSWQLDWLELLATNLEGVSVFDTNHIRRLVDELLGGHGAVDTCESAPWRRWADRSDSGDSRGPAPTPASDFDRRRVYSAIEVACLDVQGKLLGVPVVDLLGGRLQESVPYSAYLFYKLEEHPGAAGRAAIKDVWGAALDPDGIVAQATKMIDQYGFQSIKLKGGVLEPDAEVAAILALRRAFPDHPLRLDPNGAWSVEAAVAASTRLTGVLDYLEDPVLGLQQMSEVAARTSIPLATNMCVTATEHLRPALEQKSVSIVLADHHYWDGIRGTVALDAVCRAVGLGMSMHSNSHLGISLAAMTHAAAATRISHACDTHYPWGANDDIVQPGVLRFNRGRVAIPEGPGLGVELDQAVVVRLHKVYLTLGREHRNDAAYAQRISPNFAPASMSLRTSVHSIPALDRHQPLA